MQRIAQATAIVFLLASLYVVIEARSLSYYTQLGPGPGFFPFWLGALMAALSAVWLGQLLVGATEPPAGPFCSSRAGLLRVAAVVAAIALFTAVVDLVGFQLTMFAFLLFILVVAGSRHILATLGIALAGSFALFFVFTELLSVHLPVSAIPFLQDLGL